MFVKETESQRQRVRDELMQREEKRERERERKEVRYYVREKEMIKCSQKYVRKDRE